MYADVLNIARANKQIEAEIRQRSAGETVQPQAVPADSQKRTAEPTRETARAGCRIRRRTARPRAARWRTSGSELRGVRRTGHRTGSWRDCRYGRTGTASPAPPWPGILHEICAPTSITSATSTSASAVARVIPMTQDIAQEEPPPQVVR